ncbi:restriction modification system DNA specificity domain-containing protein [Nitrospira sp. KM1]|uniref:restriction endonuclease subunit S n=1 Tax=Nitrospira sp. KM1 TaxID=1936990 RepID=UPI0013A76B79|nr:restriction endonuclease subunit S [Nitrospira sp. KM1]BCA53482.1 restriction modification system DNA specificity domain-containing protein [Nitrospira sp. KM1]
MIAGLKPYPAMKDSGVPWLGDVPEHWEVRKLRHVLDRVTDRNQPDLPLLSVVREKGVIQRDTTSKDENHNFIPDDLSNYKVVRVGQFAMNKMKAWQGSYGVSHHDGIVSPAYFVFDVNGVEGEFFHAAIRSKTYVPFFTQASDGVRIGQWDLSQARMKETPFCAPPGSEQSAIVHFLDHADRRIQRYIRTKQKLIKLLEEQKQAIIHHAVTRGLDPSVRLKPSGVEWLGDVPAHWEVWQIGHFAAIGNGSTPSRGNTSYWSDGTYPWLNSSSVNAGSIVASDQLVTDSALRECHLPRVPAGSVLVAITGQGKTRGRAAVLMIEATINQHIAFITPRKHDRIATSEYLQKFLGAAYSELRRMSDDSGSTKGALTCEDLRHFRVALPPIDEQHQIVGWVKDATTEVESALQFAEREICLLREYRTRLIADVVTGKLDVREAAAKLPDASEEPGPLDDAEAVAERENDPESEDLDAVSEEAET